MNKILGVILGLLLSVNAFGQTVIDSTSKPYLDTECNKALYYPLGSLCQDIDDGKLYKGTGSAVAEIMGMAGGTFTGDVTIGTTAAGKNLSVIATEGAELAPALTGATTVNWTFAGTYTTPLNSTIEKAGAGTDTITPTAATSIVAGVTYKVVLTFSAFTVTGAAYTLGGVTGTALVAGTLSYTDYITAATTGKFILTPIDAARFVISSVSIKALTDATGDLTVRGNLVVNSPATFSGGLTVTRGQALMSDGTAALPSIGFTNDPDTGFYSYASGNIGISIDGTRRYYLDSNTFFIETNTAKIRMGSTLDLTLGRFAANTLQLGLDAATATAQKIKGPDSSTASAAGGNLSLQGGTPGAGGVYGHLILQPDGGSVKMVAAGVAHGMTTIAQTDAYAKFTPISTTIGGLDIFGLTDLTQDGALRLTGIIGAANPTDTHAAIHLRGGIVSGTGWTDLGAAETVFKLSNHEVDLITVLGNGSTTFTTSILPSAAGATVIGTTALPFSSIFIGDAATNNIQLIGTAAAAKVVTIPGITGRVQIASACSAMSGAGGASTLTVGLSNCYTFTVTDDEDTTITFSGAGNSGEEITIIFLTAGAANETITFHSTLVASTGTLVLDTTAARYYVVRFITNSSRWFEVSRTAVQI